MKNNNPECCFNLKSSDLQLIILEGDVERGKMLKNGGENEKFNLVSRSPSESIQKVGVDTNLRERRQKSEFERVDVRIQCKELQRYQNFYRNKKIKVDAEGLIEEIQGNIIDEKKIDSV
jgi:hypothetical protein